MAPKKEAFKDLKRQARFIVASPNTPRYYPREEIKGCHTMCFGYKPGTCFEHLVINFVHMYINTAHT